MVEDNHRRLGMTRREFTLSSCGMAAALLAINQAACSSSGKTGSSPRPTGGGAGCGPSGCGPSSGGGAGMGAGGKGAGMNASGGSSGSGMTTGGGSGSGGVGSGGMGTGGIGEAGQMNSGGMAGYMVDAGMVEDAGMADAGMMPTGDFIFDVQTHVSTEIEEPWDSTSPDERALDFITQIFVQSETDVAVLSGPPGARDLGPPNVAARAQVMELINGLAGRRLLIHANCELERGDSELDYMSELAELYDHSAWKLYPHEGMPLDSDEYGPPFVERARELGILMVAAHRGLWDNGGYAANSSPLDIVRTASAAPDMNFLVYHSGYEKMTDENHPYDPDANDHFGVDRMIRALAENGIGPEGNVYAELGSTWANVMTEPEQAAHVVGKLLLALGPDRILWGTDCVYNGIPQSQIVAFRMFQIPEPLREMYGYPELTAEIKAKIFGLNAARIYGVDIAAMRTEITADDVTALRMAYLDDPRSVPVPDRRRYEGPRTPRQYQQLLARDRFYRHG